MEGGKKRKEGEVITSSILQNSDKTEPVLKA